MIRFMLIRLILALIFIFSAYKLSNWKNWRKYYPTMLFYGMCDLIYNSVFHDNRLWIFEPDILVPSLCELFIIFTVFFSTILLFLSNFPKKLPSQIAYIALWVLINITIELFALSIGMQKNYNGWNIWWSLLFDTIQFPLVILHYKNPIWAWITAFIFLGIIMKIFRVPFFLN